MRRLTFLFACLFIAGISLVSAQSKAVSGKVVSAENGEPIIGASIVVKGTTSQGTISDVDGNFTLNVPSSSNTLVISFIGMKTVEAEAVDGMVIEMVDNTSELDEVMVVAFGTTTKKSFTGSAAVVKGEEISKNQSSNVTNNLAGKVAGVQGLSSNGQPGTGSTIRIRGIGSMYASNSPLYVVDGVPYDSDISAINSADIESVTVLKDAASNALYGARGANGVIIITTKRGKSKGATINVDAKWGNNTRAVPAYNVMTDPGMYYETFYRALYNSQITKGSDYAHEYANAYLLDAANGGLGYQVYSLPDGQRLVGKNFRLNPNAVPGYSDGKNYYIADDWYDELFKSNNLRQEYNVNVSGSNNDLTYYASIGKLNDTGIIANSDFSRLSARVNADYQAKKWLKIGTNMTYVNSTSRSPSDQTTTNSSGNLFFLTSSIAPIYPLYIRDADGNKMRDARGYTMYDYGDGTIAKAKRPFTSQSNPAGMLEQNIEQYVSDYFVGKWYAVVEVYKGLKLNANVGITSANSRYNMLMNPYYGQFASSGGYVSVQNGRFFSKNQQYLVTYANKFGAHNIDVLAGFESYDYVSSTLSGFQQKVFQDNVPELGNTIVQPSTTSASSSYATMGILAQLKYDYDSKYYISASYRRDASSCFAPENRWGNFWSAGAAWDINQEGFMEGADWINLLKLKASYGAQGNDNLGNLYPYIDQYIISENNGEFATALSYKGNRDITWETSYNLNFGVDFSLFDERFSGTIEGFSRRTEDMLYFKPVSPSNGYDALPVNVGSMRNAGVEVDLHADIIRTKSFTWNIYANATHVKNKILELEESLNGQWISGSYMYREGESMYNFYMREYAGVDPVTGNSLWYIDVTDADGNVTGRTTTDNWSNATRYEQGDILPKIYGGFGTSFEFYGVDLSVDFAYQLGGRIYDNFYSASMHSGYSSDAGRNWHMDILNAWTPENPYTDVPKVNSNDTYTNAMSTRFLTSSDYLSLQNVTIGYSLPTKWLKKIKLEKVRIYGVADNVWLWSARKGLDPRQSYSAAEAAVYTPIRSVSGGISITF